MTITALPEPYIGEPSHRERAAAAIVRKLRREHPEPISRRRLRDSLPPVLRPSFTEALNDVLHAGLIQEHSTTIRGALSRQFTLAPETEPESGFNSTWYDIDFMPYHGRAVSAYFGHRYAAPVIGYLKQVDSGGNTRFIAAVQGSTGRPLAVDVDPSFKAVRAS